MMAQLLGVRINFLSKDGFFAMTNTDKPKASAKLLHHLVCPITKGPLEYDAANERLISSQIKKAYPIRRGVPILIIEEAVSLEA